MTNEQIEETNIVEFKKPKLATKPADPDDPIWLNQLEIGTIFSVAKKNDPTNFVAHIFRLVGRTNKTAYLESGQGNPQDVIPAIPHRFCNLYDKHEIIRTPEELAFENKLRETQRNLDVQVGKEQTDTEVTE